MSPKLILIVATILACGLQVSPAQSDGHRSEKEVASMTSEQRVTEFCREYTRHGVSDNEYRRLLTDYIVRDALKAIPAIVKVLDGFDPTHPDQSQRDVYSASSAAVLLLGDIDLASLRLRGVRAGKAAIDALDRLTQRMRSARFQDAPSEGEQSKKIRYQITLRILSDLRETNDYDRAIQQTLELRHNITLSDGELLLFSNYLIARDPYYQRLSKTDWYVDREREHEGKSPWQYSRILNIEPFYKAYLKFKAKRSKTVPG